MTEVWKEVPGSSYYEISDHGRMGSWNNNSGFGSGRRRERRTLKPKLHDGYLRVRLCEDEAPDRDVFVHQLVLEAFVGPCPEGMEARHLDGSRDNNHLSNLCWGTRSENQADSIAHGTHNILDNRGERCAMSKLTEPEVREIRRLWATGEHRQWALAERFGVTQSTISHIVLLKSWKYLEEDSNDRQEQAPSRPHKGL